MQMQIIFIAAQIRLICTTMSNNKTQMKDGNYIKSDGDSACSNHGYVTSRKNPEQSINQQNK